MKKAQTNVEQFVKRLASNSASSEKKIIKCRKYAYEQLKEFIELIINMAPVKEAAPKLISFWVQHIATKSNKGSRLQYLKKREWISRTVSDLNKEETTYLVKVVDECFTITITQMRGMLYKVFPGLSVNKSTVYSQKKNCALSINKLEKINAAGVFEGTI